MSVRDDLANVLASDINKKFKDSKVAYFLDGSDTTPTDVTDFVSTGSTTLDLAISNRPNGGIAVGRITELNGLESSGKSLLGSHILAETQKKGGVAVYIDTETSVSTDFLGAIGVDVGSMLYLHLETVEDIFEAIEELVTKIRESDKDRLVTILVDSLAAATTRTELAGDFDKDGWATSKAIIISKAMRKITQMIGRQKICLVFTNQLRQKLGVMFGDPWTTSGGKALPFHASTRIRLKNVGQIKKGNDTVGMKMRAQVVKNRLGPPMRSADFNLFFETGLDNNGSLLQVLKDNKIVKQGGSWYTLLKDRPEVYDYCYEKVCEASILKYDPNFGIDDIAIEETPDEEQ